MLEIKRIKDNGGNFNRHCSNICDSEALFKSWQAITDIRWKLKVGFDEINKDNPANLLGHGGWDVGLIEIKYRTISKSNSVSFWGSP